MEQSQKNYPNIFFSIGFITNIITCFIVWYYISIAGPIAPLHFNVVSGFDEIGKTSTMYGIPAVAFTVLLLNFVIYKYFSNLGSYIGLVTSITATFVSLILLFNIVFLLKLVG